MVADIVRDGAERFGDRLAVADPQQELTYAELAEAVWRMAGFLRRAGVEAGDRVAIVLPNSVRFAQVHFGILAAGSISVPCDFAVTVENLLRIYENCSPRFLITDQTVIGRLEGMLAAENFEKVFFYGNASSVEVAESGGGTSRGESARRSAGSGSGSGRRCQPDVHHGDHWTGEGCPVAECEHKCGSYEYLQFCRIYRERPRSCYPPLVTQFRTWSCVLQSVERWSGVHRKWPEPCGQSLDEGEGVPGDRVSWNADGIRDVD